MDIWTDFINGARAFLGPWVYPPLSTIFILLLSLLISSLSIYAFMKLSDFEELKEKMKSVQEFQQLLKQARKSRDPELLAQLQARQGEVLKIQGEIMKARMKPSMYFFIPFIIIFYIFEAIFTGPVAYLPLNLDRVPILNMFNLGVHTQYGIGFYFWSWYFISGFAINLILQKITGTGIDMGSS